MTTSAQNTAAGAPQIFKIARRRYAFGLFWQVPENPKATLREAKAFAAKSPRKYDLCAVRTGVEAQYGLGRKADGLMPGAVAAAACAAERLKGSWLGAFRLGTGFWFVAVRDDNVIPDGDVVFEDEASARERFDKERRQGGWQTVFAPSNWFDGATEATIDEVLAGAAAPKLVELNPLAGRLKVIVGGALLIGLLGIGAYAYKSYEEARKEQREAEEARRRVAEIINQRSKEQAKVPPPWYSATDTGVALEGCLNTLERMPAQAPGYSLKYLRCDIGPAQFSARFDRVAGTAAWFEAWAAAYKDHGLASSIAANGKSADLIGRLPAAPARGEQGIHYHQAVAVSLVESAQTLRDELTLTDPRLPPPPPGVDPTTMPKPAFAPLAFTVRTFHPRAWTYYLASVPGLIVSAVEFDASTMTWKFQGDIYVRL